MVERTNRMSGRGKTPLAVIFLHTLPLVEQI
ncbi:Uncharacterised protein [Vibrio cholerae]|nr:Uncharacterised protein [Vibrio cholerae]CSI71515.1 Uncharacterised protein [Vibrio cholerae]